MLLILILMHMLMLMMQLFVMLRPSETRSVVFVFGVMRALYMLAKHIPMCSTLCNINMHSRA